MPRSRIDLIGKKLKHVGTIEAATGAEAVDIAVRELGIAPALRFKLVVIKVPDTRPGIGRKER